MSRPRTVVLWFTVSVLIVLVSGTLLLLIHPVLLTGRYYELTIHSVDFDSEGFVSLNYDDAISYGTSIFLRSLVRSVSENTSMQS